MIGRDIVIIGNHPWDESNYIIQLAMEIARYNHVLYVNPPLDRKTKRTNHQDKTFEKHILICKNNEDNLIKVSSNLWNFYPYRIIRSINKLAQGKIFNLLNKRNNKIFSKDILEAIAYLNLKDFILINERNIFSGFHLHEYLKPRTSVYLIFDFLKKNAINDEPYMEQELKIFKKYDLILSNSSKDVGFGKQHQQNNFYTLKDDKEKEESSENRGRGAKNKLKQILTFITEHEQA